jgi:hypothetical protein
MEMIGSEDLEVPAYGRAAEMAEVGVHFWG